ncbi:hypothetical protein [Devosia riboflavina]
MSGRGFAAPLPLAKGHTPANQGISAWRRPSTCACRNSRIWLEKWAGWQSDGTPCNDCKDEEEHWQKKRRSSMQPRLLIAFAVYVGSYLPLTVILLSQNIQESAARELGFVFRHWVSPRLERVVSSPEITLLAFAVSLICLLATLVLLRTFKADHTIRVTSVKSSSADLLNYVLPYVVSFMNLDYSDGKTMTGFAIFMLWLFWITYKSGQIIMNPLLTVFGWRLYEISYRFGGDETVHNGVALSRSPIEPNQEYKQRSLQDVLVVK